MNTKSDAENLNTQQNENQDQVPQLLRSFRGHKDKITQVLFNSNLKQVISSSTDGMVMTWGLRPNTRPQKFIGHKGAVYDVAVNPTGTQLASASKDNTIRLWNNNAEAFSHVLKGHSAPVKSIQFNCDGSLLLSASDDKTIKIWSVAEKKFQSTLKGHTNWIRKAQFSFDSRMIASGSDDRAVKLWDVNQNGMLIHTYTDHTGMISDVKFHPDGTCLASSGSDKKIKIFDVRSHRLLQHYDAHDDLINSISFHPQGSYLLSTSNDGTLKIWDLRKGHILFTLLGHEGPTSSGNFTPGGDYFCTGGKDSTILIWKAGLNPFQSEILHGIQTRIETEVFVTDKDNVGKVPKTEKSKAKENRPKSANKTASVKNVLTTKGSSPGKSIAIKDRLGLQEPHQAIPSQPVASNLIGGQSFKALKPEVQATLDRIVNQVELVSKTLQLLEQRIAFSEDRMATVMNHIKNTDLSFRPKLLEQTLLGGTAAINNLSQQPNQNFQFTMNQHKEDELQKQNFIRSIVDKMDGLDVGEIGTNNYEIAEGLRVPTGGEDFFRTDISQGKLPPGPAAAEFTPDQLSKIDTFLIKSYGYKNAQQIKMENLKRKDLMRSILNRELFRVYKYPDAAYQALDFRGKGYVEAQDFIEAKFIYNVPFSKEELKEFLVNETILKKVPHLKIEMFTKYFFPNALKESGNVNMELSDSDYEDEPANNTYNNHSKLAGALNNSVILDNLNTLDSTSVLSSTKNRDLTNKLKEIEGILKERLSNNWVSVRKSFLDLDQDYDGYLTAEDFAKLIGGSAGSSKFDYNLLKMLVRMRNNQSDKVNYTVFCRWFGAVIEPVEGFYFRHDSQKNPQYEKNQQKTIQAYAVGQKQIRQLLSNQNLKARFIDKLHNQFKSLQKAFIEMNKTKTGWVNYDEFQDLIQSWGFEASEANMKELFEWLDCDRDNKISYEDLRSTAGLDLSPKEALYFRQDAKPSKQVTCKYEKCWENNNFNSKSQYCSLHQKILRNLCLDRFYKIASNASEEQWESLVQSIVQANFTMTIRDLNQVIYKTMNMNLNLKDKEAVWESFKVKPHIEDNPDNIEERLVSLQALVNARKQNRLKKLNQLISMEADDEQAAEDSKAKGKEQVDENYIIKIAFNKKAQWGGIWKSIKKIDKDSNGYVTIDELDEIFREWFPLELDGKTLNRYFRKYSAVQNKNLINYKKIKMEINPQILQGDKQEQNRRMTIRERKAINQEVIKEETQIQQKEEEEYSSDDESHKRIDGQPQKLNDLSIIQPQTTKNKRIIMKVDSRKIKDESGSITPVKMSVDNSKQNTQVSPLPQMNRNTSMQRINNMTIANDETLNMQEDSFMNNYNDSSYMKLHNRSITPVMNQVYEQQAALYGRNKSHVRLQGVGQLNSMSQISTSKSLKFSEDVKIKLAYEWKNIFRAIVQADLEKKGTITIGAFNKIIHQNKVYLSREELRKLEQAYSAGSMNPLGVEIDYQKLSMELGLHKQSLDFIKNKSQKYIDQVSKFRDTPSRGSMRSQLTKSQLSQYPVTSRDTKDFQQSSTKMKTVKDFMYAYDKQHTGYIPMANFQKILRIFGLGVPNQSLLKVNELGMVEYEKVLETIQQ